jgi:GntR family transcriptional regulator
MPKAISRDDPLPLYKQVKAHILDSIYEDGQPVQSKIASERELVEQLGVSRITIRQAMKELVLEGHLQAQPGKGFYATGRPRSGFELELLRSFTETAHAHGKEPGAQLLSVEVMQAPAEIAEGLQLNRDHRVISLRRLRLLDGSPVAIAHDWVALALAPDLHQLDWSGPNRSLYGELRERYGVIPHHGQTILGATLAMPDETALLALAPPAALLTVWQTAYDMANTPINITYSVQNPVTYPLRLEQGYR